jgi:hemerythrin
MNMSSFVWEKSWETGHPMIDEQHKQLIEAINALLRACYQGAGKEELLKTLNFLNDYTIKHFFEEEQLQKKYEYPDYPNHHQYHEGFKVIVRNLMLEFFNKGVTDELTEKVRTSIGDWLVSHIKTQDVKLAAYIRSKDRGAA